MLENGFRIVCGQCGEPYPDLEKEAQTLSEMVVSGNNYAIKLRKENAELRSVIKRSVEYSGIFKTDCNVLQKILQDNENTK